MIILNRTKLKEWLKVIEQNQEWLADELGITPGYVSQIVNNSYEQFSNGKLSNEIIGKLLILTHMDFETLFTVEKKSTKNKQIL